MAHSIFDLLRNALSHYGYWAVAMALLLENAGLPLPGETILLLASFMAFSEHDLQLGWLIATGTAAATMGDNIGYAIGRHGGRPLLAHYRHIISQRRLARGEMLFVRYGVVTILFARFIFGMRVIAGPLAGVLCMPWKRFTLFNALGAGLWVTVISAVGYTFGSQWTLLMHFMRRFDLIVAAALVLIAVAWWWRSRSSRSGPASW